VRWISHGDFWKYFRLGRAQAVCEEIAFCASHLAIKAPTAVRDECQSDGLKLVDLAEVSRRAIPPEFFDDQSGCQEVLSFSTHLDCRISETHSISLFNLLPTFAYGAASVTKVLLMWTTKSTLPSLKMDVLSVH
jgi:hypothetical protein